ncbi:tyrosine recombinase XerD, partial [Klebsiella oxytoca]
MEINEKYKKKEQQAMIIRKYQQYLKLEKSLSPNTLDAYLTDLDKLMSFLTLEGIDV